MCDLEDIGVSSMLRFIRRAAALVRMLVSVKEPLNQVLARTGNLCAASMSVDAAHASVLSLYYRSQLASTPFPRFLSLFLGISIF